MLSSMLAAFVLLAVLPATHAAEPNFILKFLTPSATLGPSPNYDGYQLKYGNFVFRPAEFVSEGIILSAIFAYFLWYFVGKSLNSSRAHAWYNAHYPLLESQFSQPGTEAGLISDGASDFFNFSTGRRGVQTLHSTFALQPRHDLVQLIYHFARGMMELDYRTTDELQLDFKLPVASTGRDGFVWALVSKADMKLLRKERWDLSFTKTTENAALPANVTVMSEFADVTESILKSPAAAEIIKLLNNPSVAPYFRSLIITDQPKERPEGPIPAARKQHHLYLNLSVPPPAKASNTVPLVKAVFGIADLLNPSTSKFSLRPETTKKLRKIREDLDEELAKEAAKEQKDQAEQEKQAAKRKAEEERISRLSAAEQKKLEEKERKRAMRKQQGKMVKKK